MAHVRLQLIGRDLAAAAGVVRWCRTQWPNALPANLCFVVPTALALRRLRDALTAAYGAFQGVRFFMPSTLPELFAPHAPATATPAEQLRLWDGVFDWLQLADEQATLANFLFPGKRAWLERPTARYAIAKRFIRLRAALVEGGLDFASVAAHAATATLPPRDQQRWAALEVLEAKYRELCAAAALQDPADVQLAALRRPVPQPLEGHCNWHLIVACVPDMMPAFGALFAAAPACDILVQAQPGEEAHFTAMGLPNPDFWLTAPIDLPEAAIRPAESPTGEARQLDQYLAEQGEVAPEALCLALLNHAVIPAFTTILAEQGITAFAPEPLALTEQPAARALVALMNLARDPQVEALRPLLMLPEVPPLVESSYDELRTAYNACLEAHHPQTPAALLPFAGDGALTRFLMRCQAWVHAFREDPMNGARQFLRELYGAQVADPVRDSLFFATFDALRRLFSELSTLRIPAPKELLPELLMTRLSDATLNPLRQGADVSFEGRLEILWSPAPTLLLSGLNEGLFPDTTFDDAFLPNRFRRQLGLRSDDTRLARDAYILQTATAMRRPEALCLTFAHSNHRGDWLKPSRLFFHCPPATLRMRAKRFFTDPPPTPLTPSAETGLAFCENPAFWQPVRPRPLRFSASAIKRFLASPLDYWLQDILGLNDTEPLPDGITALAFGSLLHETLQTLRHQPGTTYEALIAPLLDALQKGATERYGASPDVCILAGLKAAEHRLHSAARLEAQLRSQGWQTRYTEEETHTPDWEVTRTIGTRQITLYGKVDRVDYLPKDNLWRVIDYKSGRADKDPTSAHWLPSSEDRITWLDFQLPLYRLFARHALDLAEEQPLELAYFTLPAKGPASLRLYNDPNHSEEETLRALDDTLAQMLALGEAPFGEDAIARTSPLLQRLIRPTL